MVSKLFYNKGNCEMMTSLMLHALKVKVTRGSIEKALTSHPDYPSMLSISDILSDFGVANGAFKIKQTDISEIPVPFITLITSEDSTTTLYTVILSHKENRITYIDPISNRKKIVDFDNFTKIWPEGTVLIVNSKNAKEEDNYRNRLWNDKRAMAVKNIAILSLPIITIGSIALTFINIGIKAVLPALFTLLSLSGTMLTILLLLFDIDKHNPAIQQVCKPRKVLNCDAILHSGASKIIGVSWNSIGFTYFMTELILLLFLGIFNSNTLFLLAWSTLFTIPYVFFSIYYQGIIAHQWCPICLCVLAVLALQIAIVFIGEWYQFTKISNNPFGIGQHIISIALACLFPLVIMNFLLPALHASKENEHQKQNLKQLKYNPRVFAALLTGQPLLQGDGDVQGIVLGNPNATQKIIKVCNPYCKPCASAYSVLEGLLADNTDVQLKIVFNSKGDDFKRRPVRHILAIAQGSNEEIVVKQALDDWYLSEINDYDLFAEKHPLNGILKEQDNKIKAMDDWCIKVGISYTPTFFVNGYRLPEIYTAKDLKYFLSFNIH